jgi:hypothetical protein
MKQPGTMRTPKTAAIVMLALCLGHSYGQSIAARRVFAASTNPIVREELLPDAPSAILSSASAVKSLAVCKTCTESNVRERALESRRLSVTITPDQRLHRFLDNSFSPSALRGDLFDAVQAHFHRDWPQYGRGFGGFEKRYFAITTGHISNNFFGTYLFPTLLHQSPHSPRLGEGSSPWRRLGYALTRLVVTRNDDGNQTFNTSLLFSTVAVNSVENLYFPRDRRGFSATTGRIEGSLIGTAQGNLSREFLPDIEHFFWKHAPDRLQRFAQQLPFSRRSLAAGFSQNPQETHP